MTAWCHGAPGIALARATALDVLDDDARREVDTAIVTTLAAGAGGPDHLCCGTLGRVDVVLTCGRILGREDLVDRAVGLAALVVQRSTERGGFSVERPGREGTGFEPGFYRGLSGIGFELLRLARPTEIPSVLAFQAPGSEA
jgi:lantibiotic modifying enzyme